MPTVKNEGRDRRMSEKAGEESIGCELLAKIVRMWLVGRRI